MLVRSGVLLLTDPPADQRSAAVQRRVAARPYLLKSHPVSLQPHLSTCHSAANNPLNKGLKSITGIFNGGKK